MSNLSKRRKQAKKNAEQLISKVSELIHSNNADQCLPIRINNLQELDRQINILEPMALGIAQSLYPDWAIPMVIQTIGEVYYGDFEEYKELGPALKRSVVYLWQDSTKAHGTHKNMSKLIALIKMCQAVTNLYSIRLFFEGIVDFYCYFNGVSITIPPKYVHDFRKFQVMLSARGRRLRVAEENTKLMNEHPHEFMKALFDILEGVLPKDIPIFADTFYEKVPGIENPECAKFWEELFFRYNLYWYALTSSAQVQDVVLFHEFIVLNLKRNVDQKTVENSFWKAKWFEAQEKEHYCNLLVDRPVVRISYEGDFATSPVLVGDSINQFIEKQLLRYHTRFPYLDIPQSVFREAFSEPFEDECIELFRQNGYLAGHILESGVWKNQKENVIFQVPEEKLFGEVDVFAYHPETDEAFVIECKVLLDISDSRTYKNILSKLRDDSEGFRMKLRKKTEWISKAFESHKDRKIQPRQVIATDIPIPLLNNVKDDIVVWDFERMAIMLDKSESTERMREIFECFFD